MRHASPQPIASPGPDSVAIRSRMPSSPTSFGRPTRRTPRDTSTGAALPTPLRSTLDLLGQSAVPLALVTVGFGLAAYRIREGIGEAGVMINFYRRDDKVRFEINARAAERNGLRISSKLLKLARVVGEE